MEQERAHKQSVASGYGAKKIGLFAAKCLNLLGRKTAQAM